MAVASLIHACSSIFLPTGICSWIWWSRSRFVLEAEITGGLEHPGIVPVDGLGQYADGRPFYFMRFIRGDRLKETVDRFQD